MDKERSLGEAELLEKAGFLDKGLDRSSSLANMTSTADRLRFATPVGSLGCSAMVESGGRCSYSCVKKGYTFETRNPKTYLKLKQT